MECIYGLGGLDGGGPGAASGPPFVARDAVHHTRTVSYQVSARSPKGMGRHPDYVLGDAGEHRLRNERSKQDVHPLVWMFSSRRVGWRTKDDRA